MKKGLQRNVYMNNKGHAPHDNRWYRNLTLAQVCMKVKGNQTKLNLHGFNICNGPFNFIEVKPLFQMTKRCFNMILFTLIFLNSARVF